VGTDDCLRDGCDHYNDCFARAAKARAEGARVIVVNYALLYAHVAMHREMWADMVLPKTASPDSRHAWDTIIYDEAHEATDKAREALGCDIGEGSFKGLARWVMKHAGADARFASVVLDRIGEAVFVPSDGRLRVLAEEAETHASALWVELEALYDSVAATTPLAHPAKKSSGWLWVLWIILLIILGAGGAAAVYYFKII
jgi:Rad3-related DNA helicase